ncbi:MAG: hypothetical protein A4E30_00241 [Methanomassiliicoccales archaeon PtaB.Bin215]|nr:MAG: hypothetical protein A4E30_00241 [Methanomassiliicoccales archaeon PtaB.Bin215]
MNDDEIRSAVEGLLTNLGKVVWDEEKHDRKEGGLSAVIGFGDSMRRIDIEYVSNGSPKAINEFAGRLLDRTDKDVLNLLVAPFFSKRGLDLCKRKGISCMDLSGNAYIRSVSLLIDRQGRENRFKVVRKQVNLFSKKSSWVVRTLLSSPQRGWTMKEMSDASGVSLAQAFKVTDALQEEGFLVKERGDIRLTDPSGLLDSWASSYQLDKDAVVGYYSPLKEKEQVFERLRRYDGDYALTMGAGAGMVAPAVRSTDVYMYTKDVDGIKGVLDLVPVEFGGNVYVIEVGDEGKMRDVQEIDGLRVVSDLQLYLDLFKYPQRGREQADMIRARRLKF